MEERYSKDCYKKRLIGPFLWPEFEHHFCLKNGTLQINIYVLDCEMLSFGQVCSITIPMNIKIALKTIHLLKSSREIIIAMALWRKLKRVVVTKIVTGNLKKVPIIRC